MLFLWILSVLTLGLVVEEIVRWGWQQPHLRFPSFLRPLAKWRDSWMLRRLQRHRDRTTTEVMIFLQITLDSLKHRVTEGQIIVDRHSSSTMADWSFPDWQFSPHGGLHHGIVHVLTHMTALSPEERLAFFLTWHDDLGYPALLGTRDLTHCSEDDTLGNRLSAL